MGKATHARPQVINRFPARVLISIGIICLILTGFIYWQRTNPQRLSFPRQRVYQPRPAEAANPPEYILIPDLHIELPIYPAQITNYEWETTTHGVSYLSSTPIPGQPGNSVLYGHNWQNLLGNLIYTKPGSRIVIEYKDRSRKTFIVDRTAIVSPDETHILDPSDDTRITIYTCTGLLDDKRFVAVAILKK